MANKKIKKSRLKKRYLFLILISIIFLLSLSTYFLLKESGIIKKEPSLKETNFSIQDRCSIIVGKIIHPIDREDECINKCIAQCEIYNLNYQIAKFELKQEDCNICNCFCD